MKTKNKTKTEKYVYLASNYIERTNERKKNK